MKMKIMNVLIGICMIQPGILWAQSAWEWIEPDRFGSQFEAISYFKGKFIAVGQGGVIALSDSGLTTWKRAESGTLERLVGLAVTDSCAYAYGTMGILLQSFDGEAWVRLGSDKRFIGQLVFGDSGAVARISQDLYYYSVLWASSDLVNWSPTSIVNPDNLDVENFHDLCFFNHTYYALSNNGLVCSSKDGLKWSIESPRELSANWVAATENQMACLGMRGEMARLLPDGTWRIDTTVGLARYEEFNYMTHYNWMRYLNGMFYLTGMNALQGVIARSPDGINWQEQRIENSSSIIDVTFGANKYISIGESGVMFSSSDGSQWNREGSRNNENNYSSVFYADGAFWSVGGNVERKGILRSSADGRVWETRPIPDVLTLNSIVKGGDVFVAVGDSGTIITSVDGRQWDVERSGTISDLRSVTYGNGMFVCAGVQGGILSSADGHVWSQHHSNEDELYVSVVYGADKFLAVTSGCHLLTSQDGVDWHYDSIGKETYPLSGVFSMVYGNGLFAMAGDEQSSHAYATAWLLISNDGKKWQRIRMGEEGGRTLLKGICFANNQFLVIGSSFGSIATSVDGVHWTPQASSTTINLQSIAWGGGQFIGVGRHGTILSVKAPLLSVNDDRAVFSPGNRIQLRQVNHTLLLELSARQAQAARSFELFSVQGKKVFTATLQPDQTTCRFALPVLAAGRYVAVVSSPRGLIARDALILAR